MTEPQAARVTGKKCSVLTESRERLVLENASVSDGQVRGHLVARDQIEAFDLERKWGSLDISFPLEEVWSIEFREVQPGRTVLAVVGGILGGLVLLVGYALGQCCSSGN
jgi:hypothetical protein